eukprot:TRINITY_DN4178_c0_g1_i1.p1 TRINITY_DN4178_c0_g1~~TRINITY_DN4178_c0_g1_i1.p1  ORF type:complete len:2279 (-),score=540.15 TRINITY_DN4178_c0_g1_i1:442-7278(-)
MYFQVLVFVLFFGIYGADVSLSYQENAVLDFWIALDVRTNNSTYFANTNPCSWDYLDNEVSCQGQSQQIQVSCDSNGDVSSFFFQCGQVPGIFNATLLAGSNIKVAKFLNVNGADDIVNVADLVSLTEFRIEGMQFKSAIANRVLNEVLTLPNLEVLMLHGIGLTEVPTSLPSLKALYLDENKLSGQFEDVFPTFSSMTHLLGFTVNANNIEGTFPDISKHVSLQILDLGLNKFNGTIPESVCNLANMRSFVIGENDFNGLLPSCMGDWAILEKFDVGFNTFWGPIPNFISKKLTHITMVGNDQKFTGTVPSKFWDLKLYYFRIHGDPDNPMNCDPDNIGFSASVRKLSSPDIMSRFQLHNCHFKDGSIMESSYNWATMQRIVILELINVNLSGTAPASIGDLGRVNQIALRDNHFTDIAFSITDFSHSTRYLDLSGNPIPCDIVWEKLAFLDDSQIISAAYKLPQCGKPIILEATEVNAVSATISWNIDDTDDYTNIRRFFVRRTNELDPEIYRYAPVPCIIDVTDAGPWTCKVEDISPDWLYRVTVNAEYYDIGNGTWWYAPEVLDKGLISYLSISTDTGAPDAPVVMPTLGRLSANWIEACYEQLPDMGTSDTSITTVHMYMSNLMGEVSNCYLNVTSNADEPKCCILDGASAVSSYRVRMSYGARVDAFTQTSSDFGVWGETTKESAKCDDYLFQRTCTLHERGGYQDCFQCSTPFGCDGGMECANHHAGMLCGECEKGYHLEMMKCEECPPFPYFGFIVLSILVGAGVFAIFKIRKTSHTMGWLFTILINMMQLSAIVFVVNEELPEDVREAASFQNGFNINLATFYPECYSINLSWFQQFYVGVVGVPLLSGLLMGLLWLRRRRMLPVTELRTFDVMREYRNSINRICRWGMMFMTIYFIRFVQLIVDGFICVPAPDGRLLLASQQTIECFKGDHTIVFIVSLGLFAFAICSAICVGIFLIYRRRQKKLHDPVFWSRYGPLYQAYNHTFVFFKSVQILRKALVVTLIKLLFYFPKYQSVSVLTVTLCYMLLVLVGRPYVRTERVIFGKHIDLVNMAEMVASVVVFSMSIITISFLFQPDLLDNGDAAEIAGTIAFGFTIIGASVIIYMMATEFRRGFGDANKHASGKILHEELSRLRNGCVCCAKAGHFAMATEVKKQLDLMRRKGKSEVKRGPLANKNLALRESDIEFVKLCHIPQMEIDDVSTHLESLNDRLKLQTWQLVMEAIFRNSFQELKEDDRHLIATISRQTRDEEVKHVKFLRECQANSVPDPRFLKMLESRVKDDVFVNDDSFNAASFMADAHHSNTAGFTFQKAKRKKIEKGKELTKNRRESMNNSLMNSLARRSSLAARKSMIGAYGSSEIQRGNGKIVDDGSESKNKIMALGEGFSSTLQSGNLLSSSSFRMSSNPMHKTPLSSSPSPHGSSRNLLSNSENLRQGLQRKSGLQELVEKANLPFTSFVNNIIKNLKNTNKNVGPLHVKMMQELINCVVSHQQQTDMCYNGSVLVEAYNSMATTLSWKKESFEVIVENICNRCVETSLQAHTNLHGALELLKYDQLPDALDLFINTTRSALQFIRFLQHTINELIISLHKTSRYRNLYLTEKFISEKDPLVNVNNPFELLDALLGTAEEDLTPEMLLVCEGDEEEYHFLLRSDFKRVQDLLFDGHIRLVDLLLKVSSLPNEFDLLRGSRYGFKHSFKRTLQSQRRGQDWKSIKIDQVVLQVVQKKVGKKSIKRERISRQPKSSSRNNIKDSIISTMNPNSGGNGNGNGLASSLFNKNNSNTEIPLDLKHDVDDHELRLKRQLRSLTIPKDDLIKQRFYNLALSSLTRLEVLVNIIPLQDYKPGTLKRIASRSFLGRDSSYGSPQPLFRKSVSVNMTDSDGSNEELVSLKQTSLVKLLEKYKKMRSSIKKQSYKDGQSKRLYDLCHAAYRYIKKIQFAIQMDTSKGGGIGSRRQTVMASRSIGSAFGSGDQTTSQRPTFRGGRNSTSSGGRKNLLMLRSASSAMRKKDSFSLDLSDLGQSTEIDPDVASSFEAYIKSVSTELLQKWFNRAFKLRLLFWCVVGACIALLLQTPFVDNSIYVPPPPKVDLDTGKCMHIVTPVCPYISKHYVSFAFEKDVYKGAGSDYGVTPVAAVEVLVLFNQNAYTIFPGMDIQNCEGKLITFMCDIMFPACYNDCSETNPCSNICDELERDCGLDRQTVWENVNDPNMKTLLSYTQPPEVIASIEMLGPLLAASCFNPDFFGDPPGCSSPYFLDETNLNGNCSITMHPEEVFE